MRTEEENQQDETPQDGKPLSPRHRKLAEMLALGAKNQEIEKALGYSTSRVSILKNSQRIREEVSKIQDAAFEEDVKTKLQRLGGPAVDLLEEALMDNRNRFSPKEKLEVAKYLADQAAGKATQKHEVTGGVLLGVMNKLDSLEKSGRGMQELPEARDVTKSLPQKPEEELTEEEREEIEAIERWKDGF